MRNQLKMTVLLGMTGLVPAMALRAQQPPDTARPAQPAAAATATAKAESTKASTDPVERIKEEGLQQVSGDGHIELPDRRDRPPLDGLAEHEARQ